MNEDSEKSDLIGMNPRHVRRRFLLSRFTENCQRKTLQAFAAMIARPGLTNPLCGCGARAEPPESSYRGKSKVGRTEP
jgi:hypothetical protein